MTDSSTLPSAVVLSSKVELITFFEDRAEVHRKVRGKAPAGSSLVQVKGIALVIDDSSLVATSRNPAVRVVAASVRRAETRAPTARASELDAREQEHQKARQRLFDAHRALDRAEAEQHRVLALLENWETSVARGARARPESLAQLRTSHDELSKALDATFDRLERCRIDLERATENEQQASLRLAQARAAAPRHEALIEVQIACMADGDLDLDLTYRTPCALWRPEHHAQLVLPSPQSPARLLIRTFAAVWQSTGEDWQGVRCRFSTARPSQTSGPPALADDLLTLQRRPDPRAIVIEERDQALLLAAASRRRRLVDEIPGVDDGGEPVTLDGKAPATLPSDGAPISVEIEERALPCELSLVAYPERAEAVYLRAAATWMGKSALLAGPVRVAVGPTLVGVASLSYIAPGEPFELGFGHDDDLRVRRSLEEKREVLPVVGSQKIQRKVRVFVSNMGRATKVLRAVERVPVSELSDVEVDVIESTGARVDPRTGFATFDLTLSPGQQVEMSLTYRIEASSRVEM